jgi:DNA primase
MDCIALHQAGIENVVASCGTAFNELQAKLLSRFTNRVIVNFDPDGAGSKATLQSLAIFLEYGFKIRVLVLPEGDDPDAFVKKQGAEAYGRRLERAPAYFDYLLQRARDENDLKSVEGKVNAVNQILPYLALVANRMERMEQTRQVAEFFGFEESIIREELKKVANSKQDKPEIRRSQLRPRLTPSEEYLLSAVLETEQNAREILQQLSTSEDYLGLPSEAIFREAISIFRQEGRVSPSRLLDRLSNDGDKEFVNRALFSGHMFAISGCLEKLKDLRSKQKSGELQKQLQQAEGDIELAAKLFEQRKSLMLAWKRHS